MQDIIDRINKLLSLASSPNEYEASAAAAKAQKILTEHNLRLEDIETSHKSPDIPIEQTEILSSSRKVYWRGFLANAIANANFCKMWWMGGRMVVAGRRHNVAIALSLYDYLTKTVERLAALEVKDQKQAWRIYLSQREGTGIKTLAQPNWRRWKSSFITGCSGRLLERIEEHKISVPRFQQERCFAWFQRKYRRLVVRWERISACFNAFISLATIHLWINRILLLG